MRRALYPNAPLRAERRAARSRLTCANVGSTASGHSAGTRSTLAELSATGATPSASSDARGSLTPQLVRTASLDPGEKSRLVVGVERQDLWI